MPAEFDWDQRSQTFIQPPNGLLANPRTGLGRLGSMAAGMFFGLPGRLAANAVINRYGPGTRYGAPQNYGPTRQGYGMGDQEWNQFVSSQNLGFSQSPGAQITNQQLSDRFDANPSINLAERMNSGQPAQQGAAAPMQPMQPSQQSPQNADQLLARAMSNPWIRHNGQLPSTPDEMRRAINSQYLDQATEMANSNYSQDIGFVAPQAMAPRQR